MSGMMTGLALALALMLASPVAGSNQSSDLAAAAEKEKERRKKSKGTAKAYGNQDLPPASEQSPAPQADSPAPNPSGEARGAPRAETYWRNRVKGLHDAIAAAEQRLAKAQADYDNARKGNLQPLPIDAISQQPPIPQVNPDADRLQKELEDAKAAVAQTKTALSDLEEEARKAGAPPGWLR